MINLSKISIKTKNPKAIKLLGFLGITFSSVFIFSMIISCSTDSARITENNHLIEMSEYLHSNKNNNHLMVKNENELKEIVHNISIFINLNSITLSDIHSTDFNNSLNSILLRNKFYYLNINNCGKIIFENLPHIKEIKEVEVKNIGLKSISSDYFNMSRSRVILLSDSSFCITGEEFINNSTEILTLDGCSNSNIDKYINSFTSLKELSLEHSKVEDLNFNNLQLKNIEYINIIDTPMSKDSALLKRTMDKLSRHCKVKYKFEPFE